MTVTFAPIGACLTGLLVFEEPIWYSSGGSYYPADLYLEATIGVRHPTNFSWQHYEYSVSVDPSGYGYVTVKHPDLRAQTVVSYNSSHAVTGTSTNQAALDAIGDAWAASIASSMGTKTSQHVVYYEPKQKFIFTLINARSDISVRALAEELLKSVVSQMSTTQITNFSLEYTKIKDLSKSLSIRMSRGPVKQD